MALIFISSLFFVLEMYTIPNWVWSWQFFVWLPHHVCVRCAAHQTHTWCVLSLCIPTTEKS